MRFLLSPSSAEIVRNLAAARGGVEFDERRIASTPGATPGSQLFDCRLADVNGSQHLLCYIPQDVRGSGYVSCVRLDGEPVLPWQNLGSDPWVDVGQCSTSQALVLGFVKTTSAQIGYTWRIGLVSTSYIDPSWASLDAPISLVCIANGSGSPPTVCQIHRGGYDLFLVQWRRGGDNTTNYGASIGDSSAAKRIDLDNRALHGDWETDGKVKVGGALEVVGSVAFHDNGIRVNGELLTLRDLNIDGTRYKVLAKPSP